MDRWVALDAGSHAVREGSVSLRVRPGRRERPDLTRLKWIAVAIPIGAVILGEAFRHLVLDTPSDDQMVHLVSGGIAVAAIVGFGIFMFAAIDRAEREILRQNRELGALNAVSNAVQDQQSQQGVIAAALRSVMATTAAVRAAVRVYPADGEVPPEPVTLEAEGKHAGGPSDPPVELPLTTGSAVVGLLQLWLPAGASGSGLSAAALQNVSHQLGCAIQLRRLVDDLQRRRRESATLYDVALLVSDQHPLADTLARVSRAARDLLTVDEVALCLTPAASNAAVADRQPAGTPAALPLATDGAVCISPGVEGLRDRRDHGAVCPVRSSPEFRHVLAVPIRSSDATLGDIWVGRHSDRPFEAADRTLLAGLADLASIAITSARLRENDRLTATVAERDRIARELHDSMAQVLGVAHLRLRAVGANPAIQDAPEVVAELADLADLAQEAFRDVRETILGLREASHLERGFVSSLSAYLDKFSRQSGIDVTLDARLGGEPDLGPSSEVQVIRVIQEALANVRKHAGADTAVVRLENDAAATTIAIEDDGRGFDVAGTMRERDDGFGLHTMRERMELLGGTLRVDSAVGQGTRVIARIPKTTAPVAAA